MENNNGNKELILKYLTPILVTVSLFLIASLKGDIEKIDIKLFNHLTNDEMHTPRSYIVTKSEFNIQKEYLKGNLSRVRLAVSKLTDKLDDNHSKLLEKIINLKKR